MCTTKNVLDKIVKELKKYPFTEKMLLCQQYSTQLMEYSHMDILSNRNAIYPWELETFAELALFADAPIANKSFKGKNIKKFIDMINDIRNYQHPFLKKQKNIDFVNAFIMVTALQQFKSQENILDRLYRYDYFWDFSNDRIDMKHIFSKFFEGTEYSDFRDFAVLIFFYASFKNNTSSIVRTLCVKYMNTVKFLMKSREEYKRIQSDKIEENFENVIFGFNYLHPFPFIEQQGLIFLPLPYLVIDAVTESLLTRVTFNNNTIREKIGKEVAQTYIETIFKECSVYDEVLPETSYKKGKNNIDTPDVLIRCGKQFCFIDTKLSTPKLDIRKFKAKEINDTISMYAKYVIQAYNRTTDFNNGLYYPFNDEATTINRENTFGIVALLEDAYISKRQIYQQVFNQLNINPDSEEARYIKSNIKITNFRDLELFAFRGHNIFVSLNKKRDNETEWYDMGLFDDLLFKESSASKIPSVVRFEDKCRRLIRTSIDDFVASGIIPKQ
ncbi:MAG: hypothetical protein E7538_09410 [Ruminococcaceae bacterium]|nr:hypothetical protein [Oscillospiraceae bacterium]